MVKKITAALALLSMSFLSFAQIGFETLTLTPPNQYWKGVAAVPTVSTFYDQQATFINSYDTAFGGSWSGWGYSALNDTTSISYTTNELGCIAGKGQGGSNQYGVAYLSFVGAYNKIIFNGTYIPVGMFVTNTTIAYRSMQHGDLFAKKFGGNSGNDPDFFKIRLTGWHQGIPKLDTIDIYLADFRDSNNTNDYIQKNWKWASTSLLGACDSLTYTLESSDTAFGFINTPSYFCMDNLNLMPVSSTDWDLNTQTKIYPNPAQDVVFISNDNKTSIKTHLQDMYGHIIKEIKIEPYQYVQISVQDLASGMYLMSFEHQGKKSHRKLIIN
ncbi:MAG: DUF4465 domain-containing protein [Chitinophagaceae bacterium]